MAPKHDEMVQNLLVAFDRIDAVKTKTLKHDDITGINNEVARILATYRFGRLAQRLHGLTKGTREFVEQDYASPERPENDILAATFALTGRLSTLFKDDVLSLVHQLADPFDKLNRIYNRFSESSTTRRGKLIHRWKSLRDAQFDIGPFMDEITMLHDLLKNDNHYPITAWQAMSRTHEIVAEYMPNFALATSNLLLIDADDTFDEVTVESFFSKLHDYSLNLDRESRIKHFAKGKAEKTRNETRRESQRSTGSNNSSQSERNKKRTDRKETQSTPTGGPNVNEIADVQHILKGACAKCGSKEHQIANCSADRHCVFCKNNGHSILQCRNLNRRIKEKGVPEAKVTETESDTVSEPTNIEVLIADNEFPGNQTTVSEFFQNTPVYLDSATHTHTINDTEYAIASSNIDTQVRFNDNTIDSDQYVLLPPGYSAPYSDKFTRNLLSLLLLQQAGYSFQSAGNDKTRVYDNRTLILEAELDKDAGLQRITYAYDDAFPLRQPTQSSRRIYKVTTKGAVPKALDARTIHARTHESLSAIIRNYKAGLYGDPHTIRLTNTKNALTCLSCTMYNNKVKNTDHGEGLYEPDGTYSLHIDTHEMPLGGYVFLAITTPTLYTSSGFRRHKHQSTSLIREFITEHQQLGIPITTMHTDSGTEYVNADMGSLLEEFTIRHVRSSPYNQRLNSYAEGVWRWVKEHALALHHASHLHAQHLQFAFHYAAHVHNHTLHGTETMTPAQKMGVKPHKITTMPIYGEPVQTPIPKVKRRSMQSNGVPGIFVGFDRDILHGYLVLHSYQGIPQVHSQIRRLGNPIEIRVLRPGFFLGQPDDDQSDDDDDKGVLADNEGEHDDTKGVLADNEGELDNTKGEIADEHEQLDGTTGEIADDKDVLADEKIEHVDTAASTSSKGDYRTKHYTTETRDQIHLDNLDPQLASRYPGYNPGIPMDSLEAYKGLSKRARNELAIFLAAGTVRADPNIPGRTRQEKNANRKAMDEGKPIPFPEANVVLLPHKHKPILADAMAVSNFDNLNYKPDPQVLSKIDFEAFPTDKDIAFYLDVNNAPAALPHTLKAARQPPNYPFYEYGLAKETLGFEANNAFTLVPKGSQRITRTRAVFVKRPDGRAKVRIAIRGDTIPVEDGEITESTNVQLSEVRMLLSYAVHHNMHMATSDVSNAYLAADYHGEDIFIEPWMDMYLGESTKGQLLKVAKFVYGLREAGNAFQQHRDSIFKQLGFLQLHNCKSIYYLTCSGPDKADKTRIFIATYVDDYLYLAPTRELIEETYKQLQRHFQMTGLKDLTSFIGLQIETFDVDGRRALRISIENKIRELIKDCSIDGARPASTPAIAGGYPLPLNVEQDTRTDQKQYRRLIGRLLWMARACRYDILYATCSLARFVHAPSDAHKSAALQIVKYLMGTINFGITYTYKVNSELLTGYSDASYNDDPVDRKSNDSSVWFHHGHLVGYDTNRQKITSLSSCDAETIGAVQALRTGEAFRNMISELYNIGNEEIVIVLHMDSRAAIDQAHSELRNKRNKHLDARYVRLHDFIKDGTLELRHVSSEQMLADIGTKPLALKPFKHLVGLLGLNITTDDQM